MNEQLDKCVMTTADKFTAYVTVLFAVFLLILGACSEGSSPKGDQSYNANVPAVKVFSLMQITPAGVVAITPIGNELYILTNGEASKAKKIPLTEPEAVHLNSMLADIDPADDADIIAEPVAADEQLILTIPVNNVFSKYTSGYTPDGTFHLMARDVQVFVDYVIFLSRPAPRGDG
jgi:hypothetical protein